MKAYLPNWTWIGNRLDEFHKQDGQPPVDFELYAKLSTSQNRRLQAELAKPENSPYNLSCNVNELMKKILIEEPE